MSLLQKDPTFPRLDGKISPKKLIRIVSGCLVRDFAEYGDAIKRISRYISAEPRMVKNWYAGRNSPSASHLLQLAGISSSLRNFILCELGAGIHPDVPEGVEAVIARSKPCPENRHSSKINSAILKYSELHYKSKFSMKTLPDTPAGPNQRQRWFISALQGGHRLKAPDLAIHWQVSLRTAKSDIAGLRKMGLIRFTGARKDGEYQVT